MAKDQRFTDFIVQLYANKSSEDRERSRALLREQFEDCDSRLNDLVKGNRDGLSSTVELCGRVIRTVNESKSRLCELRNRIVRCQSMLQCNRDNIRKMWLESLEHKYAHRILSEIEELRMTPHKVKESLIDKKLEHATEVIVASVKLLDGNLCNAEALKELRSELHHLQEKLYLMILEDLRKSLQLTDFVSSHYAQNLGEVTYDDVFSNKIPLSDHSFKELLSKVTFDGDYVTVLLKCAVTMKRLPDAVEVLKENCQSGLVSTSQEISKLMYDTVEKSVESTLFDLPTQRQRIFLVDLVEHVVAIFRKILDNYKNFFPILKNITETCDIVDVQIQAEDIYSKFQSALETFIGPYLESHPTHFLSAKDSFSYENSQNIVEIGSFFNPFSSSDDKSSLFKFSNSCHGISLKKYSKETKVLEEGLFPLEETKKVAKTVLVCRSTLRNITLIFGLLKDFVSDIENSLNLCNGDHCPLYAYLCDCANMLLDQVNSDINKMLKSASANLEAWNTVPVGDGCSSEKEVLSCSLILENVLKELQDLMRSLPDYSTHFLRLVYYVILDYKDMYLRAFKQMFEEEQNVLSVSWARDRDIRRLMKSFLNWRHLEDEEFTTDVVESPEEVRLRNQEESELLIRNLRAEDETPWDIIADSSKLANLALLQENLMWFSVALLRFIKDFNGSNKCAGEDSVSSAVSGLRKVIKEYGDFADTCLLALHLEVRARCFHHLQPFARGVSPDLCPKELESAVKCLTSDLLQIDEVLLPILTPKEFKYVFEGLGELVSSIVIMIVSNMSRMSEEMIRAIDRGLFVVQCCLGSITMAREMSLERARGFVELLSASPGEILDRIMEEGPRFSEREYASVLRLVSSDITPAELEYHLEKLGVIFKRLDSRVNEASGDAQA